MKTAIKWAIAAVVVGYVLLWFGTNFLPQLAGPETPTNNAYTQFRVATGNR